MEPERWAAVQALFHRAVELEPSEREALLARECGADAALRAEVQRLLRHDAGAAALLDAPGAALGERGGDPWIGRQLGVFRLTQRIGAGGMGVVYAAERADGLFAQRVAVKLLRAGLATPELLRRFERERRTLAALDHPNIARLLDGGTTPEGEPYLVMELVEGLPIDRYCDARRLSIDQRLRLFAEVCRAVHHAHTSLVVHRDLKPGNVLVDAGGAPKLLDFGIARLVAPQDEEEELTQTSQRLLTPEYASPEQLAGAPITTASDVYSLGVVLYGLLTGRKPFRVDSGSPAAWERLVSERAPTRPSTAVLGGEATSSGAKAPPLEELAARCGTTPARLRHRLRGDLDRIVLMALRKEPERRYSSARALADDLERHLSGHPVIAREDSLLYRLSRFALRNRVAVAAGVLVAAALVYGLVAARRGERAAAEQALHARIEADTFRETSEFLLAELLSAGELESPEQRERTSTRILRQADIVRRRHDGDPHRLANLIDALGRAALRLSMFELAEALYGEAYERRRAHFGADSLEVALSLGSLGELAYRAGDYGAAVEHLTRALALHRAHPDETHSSLPTAANDAAVALRNVGELERAEALHREALALRRGEAPGTVAVAESLNNLAGVLLDRGRHEEAAGHLEEALEIRREVLGPGHPLTLQGLSNLANATWHVGRHDRAVALFEEAAAGQRALRGEGLDGLDVVLSALASIHTVRGELERARAALEEVRALRLGRLGPEHPLVALMHVKLAELHDAAGEPRAALEEYERALAIQRALDPPPPLALARTLRQSGMALANVGRLEEGRERTEEALVLLESTAGADEAELGRVQTSLGILLRAEGRLDEALEQLRAGLERLESAGGVLPRDVELARGHLAEAEAAR